MKLTKWLSGLTVVALIVGVTFLFTGGYDVAADVPHWSLTHSAMETIRARSIARRSAGIEIPALDNARLVASGAGNYDAMCAGCHLKPGVESTEMSIGLYPAPPNFTERRLDDPAAAFWVIKHGIKMSGMPAWGKSMDDSYVWGLVAFVQELPGMTADRYRELVHASGGHHHGGSESGSEQEVAGHEHESEDESGEHEHKHDPKSDSHTDAPPHQH